MPSLRAMHLLAVAAIGAGVGFLGGLFGKGGSAVATPLLALIGVPAIAAVASPLPATIPGTLVAFRRYRQGGFEPRSVIIASIAWGVPATIVGALLTRWIGGGPLVLVTDIVLVGLGLRIAVRRHDVAAQAAPRLGAVRVATVAATVGFVAGLLGNSGGFLLVPLYLAVLRLPVRQSLAASLAVAACLAVPGTIVHAALGHIDWVITGVFALTSIPLSSLGARTALRTESARLERIYGIGLIVLGAVLIPLH